MAVTPPPSGQSHAGAYAGHLLAGRYRLDDVLASGGMAQVWRGTDEILRRAIAIKVLHPHLTTDETFVARFRQEAIAVAKLSHHAIVSVYDTCSDNGVEAIVMELITGKTLRQRLDAGPLDPWEAAGIATQVAGALEIAHASGLVHRDIKPANILMGEDGRVKVGDFGIAKAAESSTDLTQEGSFVGTAKYLAPEQVEGKRVDGRSDLYSLGVVLYEMLTGQPPFQAEGTSATALARLHSDPVPVAQLRPDIPPELQAITMGLLARQPDARPANARLVQAALVEAGADPTGRTDRRDYEPVPSAMPAAAPPGMRAPASGSYPAAGRSPQTSGVNYGSPPTDHTEIRGGATEENPRNWVVPGLLIVLTAVSLGIAGLLIGRSSSNLSDDDPVDNESPAVEEEEPAADAEPVGISGFDDYDPVADGGDGEESPDRLANINDGDPASSWRTALYNASDIYGPMKPGVGVVVELDEATTVTEVILNSPSDGFDVEILVADDYGQERADWGDPQATGAGVGHGETSFELDEPTEGRYVLIYFTEAASHQVTPDGQEERVANASGQPRYAAAIANVDVLGQV